MHNYEYIVAIGTSTGGPQALSEVVTALSGPVSATFVVVQHMPAGFTKSLATRLNTLTPLTVKEAEDKEVLMKGTIYIAPGGKQLKIMNGNRPEICLTDEEPYKGHRPSVNVMFESIANLKQDRRVLGVIMTGMGCDGIEGMASLKEKTKLTVIAQNEQTCVVYVMPRAVVVAGLADYIVPINEIGQLIERIVGE